MTSLETVENAYELFGKGDIDSLRLLMDDEISIITYGDFSHAGSYVRPDEVIEKNFQSWLKTFQLYQFPPRDYGKVRALFL